MWAHRKQQAREKQIGTSVTEPPLQRFWKYMESVRSIRKRSEGVIYRHLSKKLGIRRDLIKVIVTSDLKNGKLEMEHLPGEHSGKVELRIKVQPISKKAIKVPRAYAPDLDWSTLDRWKLPRPPPTRKGARRKPSPPVGPEWPKHNP